MRTLDRNVLKAYVEHCPLWISGRPTLVSSEKLTDDGVRRRKLAFQATHRGMKEMDLVLGGYVAQNINSMTTADLDVLEQIIALPDVDLLSWVIGKVPVPEDKKSSLLDAILAFSINIDDYTRT
jgi:antitoxin CptB